MVAAQTAEQKAAADKAAAEKQAAEQKAAEEKAAAEKAAEAKKAAESDAEPSAPAARYTVTGALAVIRTKDGSERYLYRGAPVEADAFDADSIKHLVEIGLVTDSKAKAKK